MGMDLSVFHNLPISFKQCSFFVVNFQNQHGRYHILNNREGRIRKKAEWTAASPERNAENAAFQEKYIYEASFPVYDALHISHSSGAS